MKTAFLATSMIISTLLTDNPVSNSPITKEVMSQFNITKSQLYMVQSDINRITTEVKFDLQRLDTELKRFDTYRQLTARAPVKQTANVHQALDNAFRQANNFR